MAELAYPPAARVAPTVHERLSRLHGELPPAERPEAAELPPRDVIERLVEAAFWASLRREEGRFPTISLAFLPFAGAREALALHRPVPLVSRSLTRLAPAVARPGIHLCVHGSSDRDLQVWGATRFLPHLCFVVEVVEPGMTVLKHNRVGGGRKFGNLAVLEGEIVKVVDDGALRDDGCSGLLDSLLGAGDADPAAGGADLMVRFALSMRAHGHGGTLLVVPSSAEWWRSLVAPIPYRAAPPFSRLADLVRDTSEPSEPRARLDQVHLAVEGLAGLTAVDGATVISQDYELLAFGAKIQRVGDTVDAVVLLEPVVGRVPTRVDAAELGGTRHLSAAQFVHDNHDALALVASQDGRVTFFDWSSRDHCVHAHRIEILLL